jgi:uncharacterized lipoprotein YehR (DUF1307 family)
MKKLVALVFASVLSLAALTACAKEEAAAPAVEAPKTKQVCIDTKGKDGKVVKQCKTVKIHKKFEGTKVPEKAKK